MRLSAICVSTGQNSLLGVFEADVTNSKSKLQKMKWLTRNGRPILLKMMLFKESESIVNNRIKFRFPKILNRYPSRN